MQYRVLEALMKTLQSNTRETAATLLGTSVGWGGRRKSHRNAPWGLSSPNAPFESYSSDRTRETTKEKKKTTDKLEHGVMGAVLIGTVGSIQRVSTRCRSPRQGPCSWRACSCPCLWRDSCGWSSVGARLALPGWCRGAGAAGRSTSGQWGGH